MRILTDFHRFQSGYGRWVAWDDDTYYYSDDPKGFGQTEQEAIEDLQQQLSCGDNYEVGSNKQKEVS